MPRLPGWALLLLAIVFATMASYMAMGFIKTASRVQPPSRKKIYVVRANERVEKEQTFPPCNSSSSSGIRKASPRFFDTVKNVEGGKLRNLWRWAILLREKPKMYHSGMAGR